MPLHPAKTLVENPDPLADPDTWAKTLAQVFANPARTEGFLAQAEKAERACPGDPIILFQAAMAALLDRRPDKAQLYLKRYAKRYAASEPYHLLSALTLAAQKNLIAARALLERHRLTDWRIAMGSFPGGWERRHWLVERLDAIMGRERPTRTRKPAVKPAPVLGRPKSSLSTKSAALPPAQARPAAQPAIPTLERLQVDIPLVVDFGPEAAACRRNRSSRERRRLVRLARAFRPPRLG